ncbi:GGDEF domain-containing protein [Treponema sp.]|uniref:GGDEF domain-containing protein n=1 Tax=Treponema sp. TaxID=166 RepID=UPI0025D3E9E6|nr:GGDEF domain-containing protein [Treponema sp.]MCR5217698.1 GGDEF domain-containing protein [Treponema sp.]
MDFQDLVDSYEKASAVISVRKTEDGHYDEIRIVCVNDSYRQIMGGGFKDNILYSELIPKEPNFEDFCYRAAVLKQSLHSYVDTKSLDVWTDGVYLPLSSKLDKDNLCYFLFSFEFTKKSESERMSNVSMETASNVIQTCINLRGTDNFYESMNKVITDIQKITDSFCSCIIMIDSAQKKYAPLCSKFRDDNITINDFMPYLTPDVVLTWEATILKHDNIIIKDEFDMAELEKINPVWVKSLRDAGVKSLILAPLTKGNKLMGVLFVTNFNTDKIVEFKEYIELSAFFLTAEVASNELLERLEYMSNVDTLTGVKNRNSMNARVDWHVKKHYTVTVPYGIIFVDLNGLKQCNDAGGHEAGDELLINAANLLKRHFENYEIYRSGGDEFVIILPGCKKEELEEKVKKLRAETGYGSEVCLAIGYAWTQTEQELRKCMHIADEAMYADKKEFYRQHKELKQR